MNDSGKLKTLAEDYKNIQRAMEDLTDQIRQIEKSDEYLLGKKIFSSRWLSFIGSAYKLGRAIKSGIYGRQPLTGGRSTRMDYTDPLSLYNYKIAVYTCILGGYDRLLEPAFRPRNVDYILVTDGPLPSGSAWKAINVHSIKGSEVDDDSHLSRYIKLHPHLFLDEYDFSIYIDGNIHAMGDIRYLIRSLNPYGFTSNLHRSRDCIYEEIEACARLKKADPQAMRKQIDEYRSAGMPSRYGLIEANLLVRDHHNPSCIEIMERWWREIAKHRTRDQLSLPFVLWKMGIPVSEIGRIGHDVNENPLIRIHAHVKE